VLGQRTERGSASERRSKREAKRAYRNISILQPLLLLEGKALNECRNLTRGKNKEKLLVATYWNLQDFRGEARVIRWREEEENKAVRKESFYPMAGR